MFHLFLNLCISKYTDDIKKRTVRRGSCLSMPRPPLGTSNGCDAGTTATDSKVIHDWLESSLAAARVLHARTEQQMLSKSCQLVSDKSSMYNRF